MPNLLDLPDELLIGITGYLYYASDVNALSQTCRRLWQVADPWLYSCYARVSSLDLEHIAAKGNTVALRRLFSENGDSLLGREDSSSDLLQDHLSSFFTAMTKGHMNVAHLLVEFYGGMVVDLECPPFNDTLLYSAIKGNHCDVIRYLLDVANPPDRRGCFWPATPLLLLRIGRYCPISLFKSLVEDPRTDINATDKSGRTLFWQMIELGQVELVQVLLDAGADPLVEYPFPVDMRNLNNAGLTEMISPLKHAILRGKEDIARLLLERGAYGDLKKGLKPRILSQTMERSGPSLPWLILEKIPEPWLYYETTDDLLCIMDIAAANGNMHLVRQILDKCSSEEENPCFETAIGYAAQYGHVDVVQCLLPPGLSIKEVEAPPAYISAMVGACKGMQTHVIDFLLDRVGPKLWNFLADPRYSFIRGEIGGDPQFSSYLLEKNAFDLPSPTTLDISDICATAMGSENFPLLEYFLAQIGIPCPGSSKREIGGSWRFETILQEALVLGTSDVFHFLLDKRADLDSTDPAWQNLAIMAVSWNRFEVVEYFLNHGFDINTRCKIHGLAGESGWTYESEPEVDSDRETEPDSRTVWYGTMLEAAVFWLALPCFPARLTEEESSAQSDSTKMAQMLFDRGADIYTVNRNSEEKYLFEILIEYGGSTVILNEFLSRGVSPLTPVKSAPESLLAYAFRLLPKQASSANAELLVQHVMRLNMSCEDFRSLIPPHDEEANRDLKKPLLDWKLDAQKRMWRHYWRMKYPVDE